MKEHVINSSEGVRKKLEMLGTLIDIKITEKLKGITNQYDSILDQNYQKLKTNIKPINKSEKIYE